MLHPEPGAQERNTRAAEEGRELWTATPANPHWHVSPQTSDKKVKTEVKSDVFEGHTEVVELRRNVNVHTFVLPVTLHLRSCSPAYVYPQMRWETSDFKVPHLSHSNLATWWKLRCLLLLELFLPACTEPIPWTAFYPVPAFRDYVLTPSGANYSNRYNSAVCWCNLTAENKRQEPWSTAYQWSKAEGFGLKGIFFCTSLRMGCMTWLNFSPTYYIHTESSSFQQKCRSFLCPGSCWCWAPPAAISRCPHLSHLSLFGIIIDLKVSKTQTRSLYRGNTIAPAVLVTAFPESSSLLLHEKKNQE